MPARPLLFFDETLRDGEQQAGLFLSPETKRTLAPGDSWARHAVSCGMTEPILG